MYYSLSLTILVMFLYQTASALPDAAAPLITAPPALQERRLRRAQRDVFSTLSNDAYTSLVYNPSFIGWWDAGGGTTLSVMCDNTQTYTTSDIYAMCCDYSVESEMMTACDGSTLLGASGYSYDCQDASYSGYNYVCSDQTIFQSAGDPSPLYYVDCYIGGYPTWTVTRNVLTSTTLSSSSQSSKIATATSSGPPVVTSVAPAPPPQKKKSKAWIAGAVIGPVAGIALCAALGWFLWRRHHKKDESVSAPPAYLPADTASPIHDKSPQGGDTDDPRKSHYSEPMSAGPIEQPEPVELASNEAPPQNAVEMEGTPAPDRQGK